MSQIFKEVWLLSLTRRCLSLQLPLTAALGTCVLRLERPLLLKRCWCKVANHGDLTGNVGKRRCPNLPGVWAAPASQNTALPLAVHALGPHVINQLFPDRRTAAEDKGGTLLSISMKLSEPAAGGGRSV